MEVFSTYELDDDWTMTVDRGHGHQPLMRLEWFGEDPCVELEIPPKTGEQEMILLAKQLAATYQRGYNHGCEDERRKIIRHLQEGA